MWCAQVVVRIWYYIHLCATRSDRRKETGVVLAAKDELLSEVTPLSVVGQYNKRGDGYCSKERKGGTVVLYSRR